MSLIILFLVVVGVIMIVNRNNSGSFSSSNTPATSDPSTLAAKVEYYYGSPLPASNSAIPKPPSIREYVYPGSQVKTDAANKMIMESADTPEKITDWYKTKIDRLNFNAKSLSQTSTNGAIFNKLTAAKPGEKIDITIKKDQNTSNTLITVDRS